MKKIFSGNILRTNVLGHKIYFNVAPKKGLYSSSGLDNFMEMLVPDLKHDSFMFFTQTLRGNLHLGNLVFNETIRERKVSTVQEINLTDDELLDLEGFTNGKKRLEHSCIEKIEREIRIIPFPDERFARDRRYFNNGIMYQHKINLEKALEFYQNNSNATGQEKENFFRRL